MPVMSSLRPSTTILALSGAGLLGVAVGAVAFGIVPLKRAPQPEIASFEPTGSIPEFRSPDAHAAPASPFGASFGRVAAGAVSQANALAAALGAMGEAASRVSPPDLVSAYAPAPARVPEIGPGPAPADEIDAPAPQRADAPALREAIEAYRKGDVEKGDAAAANALDELGRTALRWASLRLQARKNGYERLDDFIARNPDWPTDGFLVARRDDALFNEKAKPAVVRAHFAAREPATPTGRLALARAHVAEGRTRDAEALVRRVWREDDFGTWLEGAVRKEFGAMLTAADHRYRASRLFYKEQTSASLRIAALVSPDYVALAKARNAVADEAASDKLLEAVPAALRDDPSYAFARAQKLRRAGKFTEAAAIILAAPRDAESIVSGDAWWEERRILARKLLDAGETAAAYQVASTHTARGVEAQIEAEFHAGWIALRFLNDPKAAAGHFAAAAKVARTPISLARVHYWQARAAEAGETPEDAPRFYALAALHSSAYYGQLARARLGFADQPVRRAARVAEAGERLEPIRAVELFESIGEKDLAFRLTADLARSLEDEAQIAALGRILTRARDARATLVVGKLASQRGVALDDVAYPTFGIPAFEELARSAEKPVVYAIARQESAFQADAASHAGAKGLMQMLVSTARRTAQRAGVAFDEKRLVADPAFNAQLGAAHLAELMDEHGQSLILTFAAYNAGGHRVKQWIAAYGDPRKPEVDPIDWIERIPFTETRNYVQRVAENLGVYRARFGAQDAPRLVVKDLRAREARLGVRAQ
ncbi:MAG: Lytic transglycosylase [Hyphomicrobiales bacterium]|nr:Lytic transglycosylase [Hyphomicrobiales bacterium]